MSIQCKRVYLVCDSCNSALNSTEVEVTIKPSKTVALTFDIIIVGVPEGWVIDEDNFVLCPQCVDSLFGGTLD